MATTPIISGLVEGSVDEAALRQICRSVGATLGDVYGRRGKGFVLENASGYNNSARFRHWVVLVDLDNDFSCAPEALQAWLPTPANLMRFRVAVREVEAWLLADRERVASFLGISTAIVPPDPESLPDPKLELINLARRSRSRALRDDIVPDPGAGQSEGPAYSSRMIEFISDPQDGWRPAVASNAAPSLARCIAAVEDLTTQPYPAP